MQYFDLIITHHAQEQIQARGLKLDQVWDTFKHPTRIYRGKYNGMEFQKEFEDFKVTLVAIQNQKNEWVVKSAWRNPPMQGTKDAKQKAVWKEYNRSGFFGKVWIQIRQQLGIG